MITKLGKLRYWDENNRQIFINTILAFIVRGLGMLVSLFTMPAYMRYFKDQKILGLWFTLLAVLSWIFTFDLGIGNGLRNRLVKPLIEHDMESAKKYISSAYIITSILVIVVFVIGYIIIPFINWNVLFNISSDIVSKQILFKTIRVLFIGMLLQFLFKIIYSIFYALQKSVLPNFLSLISNILLLIFVIYSNSGSTQNNLILLAKANVFFSNIPIVITTIIVFLTELKACSPSINFFKMKYAMDIMKLGFAFFWLQMMSLILTSTNELLITWFTGTKNVVYYQIYNKLFSLIGTIFTLALTPIWSAVTKAFSQNNFIWIRKLYKVLKYISIIFIIAEFALIFVLQLVVNIWLGKNAIKINNIYALVFAISGSLYIWHSSITSIVNGMGKLKIQFILLTLGGIINIPVVYILFKITGSWISIICANIISLLPYCIIQPFYIDKYLRVKGRKDNDTI